MHFSKIDGEGFKVPSVWRYPHQSCYVLFDFYPNAKKDATYPMRDIAAAIIVLVNTCVTDAGADGLGGRISVGLEGRMFVVVAAEPFVSLKFEDQQSYNWTAGKGPGDFSLNPTAVVGIPTA